MGKQITWIRLLQRPGPVKDGSRRSRQRWDLYVYVHTLTVMTHTRKLRWCVNSIQLRCGFVWLVLSTTKTEDPVHVAGGCSVCVQWGRVRCNIGVAGWGTYRAGSDFILPAWCVSLTLRQSRKPHSCQYIRVCVCFSHPHLWVLGYSQSSTKDVCISLKAAMYLSCRQTSLGSSPPQPPSPVRTDWKSLLSPRHRKSESSSVWECKTYKGLQTYPKPQAK